MYGDDRMTVAHTKPDVARYNFVGTLQEFIHKIDLVELYCFISELYYFVSVTCRSISGFDFTVQ